MASARIDKGENILRAALEIFARDGFTAAKVDDIARQAGVAKPTIYHRFGDKESLFVEALQRGAALSYERIRSAIDATDVRPEDLRSELERLGEALMGCLSHGDGVAVTRLQISEQSRFPELIRGLRSANHTRTNDALAGKLAQLAATGYLSLSDPQRAAAQFVALVTAEALAAVEYGDRPLPVEEIARTVHDGVATFLAAFSAPKSTVAAG